jgi:hypothetical protein
MAADIAHHPATLETIKNGQGRLFEPTAEQRQTVERMSGLGIPQKHIAAVVGVAMMTLRKHFEEELELGAARANTAVAQFLFDQATGARGDGSVAAAIFWAKTRMGWKETVVSEHVGSPPDLATLTAEERAALVANVAQGLRGASS